jgi:hypothetical protein
LPQWEQTATAYGAAQQNLKTKQQGRNRQCECDEARPLAGEPDAAPQNLNKIAVAAGLAAQA